MDGKKAKLLRRAIYGDMSLKAPRESITIGAHIKKFLIKDTGQTVDRLTGTVICTGLRRKYQEAKAVIKAARRA